MMVVPKDEKALIAQIAPWTRLIHACRNFARPGGTQRGMGGCEVALRVDREAANGTGTGRGAGFFDDRPDELSTLD